MSATRASSTPIGCSMAPDALSTRTPASIISGVTSISSGWIGIAGPLLAFMPPLTATVMQGSRGDHGREIFGDAEVRRNYHGPVLQGGRQRAPGLLDVAAAADALDEVAGGGPEGLQPLEIIPRQRRR